MRDRGGPLSYVLNTPADTRAMLERIATAARERGLIIRPLGNAVIALAPPSL